jgi:hypothetical protein
MAELYHRVSKTLKARAFRTIWAGMSLFLDNARRIFETAASAPAPAAEMSILIDSRGAIEMVADSDWPLDSLCRERGAAMGYRVTSRGGSVRLEGRSGLQACLIEQPHPARTAERLLLRRPLPAGMPPLLPAA